MNYLPRGARLFFWACLSLLSLILYPLSSSFSLSHTLGPWRALYKIYLWIMSVKLKVKRQTIPAVFFMFLVAIKWINKRNLFNEIISKKRNYCHPTKVWSLPICFSTAVRWSFRTWWNRMGLWHLYSFWLWVELQNIPTALNALARVLRPTKGKADSASNNWDRKTHWKHYKICKDIYIYNMDFCLFHIKDMQWRSPTLHRRKIGLFKHFKFAYIRKH